MLLYPGFARAGHVHSLNTVRVYWGRTTIRIKRSALQWSQTKTSECPQIVYFSCELRLFAWVL